MDAPLTFSVLDTAPGTSIFSLWIAIIRSPLRAWPQCCALTTLNIASAVAAPTHRCAPPGAAEREPTAFPRATLRRRSSTPPSITTSRCRITTTAGTWRFSPTRPTSSSLAAHTPATARRGRGFHAQWPRRHRPGLLRRLLRHPHSSCTHARMAVLAQRSIPRGDWAYYSTSALAHDRHRGQRMHSLARRRCLTQTLPCALTCATHSAARVSGRSSARTNAPLRRLLKALLSVFLGSNRANRSVIQRTPAAEPTRISQVDALSLKRWMTLANIKKKFTKERLRM